MQKATKIGSIDTPLRDFKVHIYKYVNVHCKTMRILSIIGTIFLLFSDFMAFGQGGVIQGHLYDRKECGLSYAYVKLAETKIGVWTDSNGNFKIDSIPIGTYNLIVNYFGYEDTTLKALKISSDTLLIIELEFPAFCKYDKHRKNNTCPICGKNNKVVPIVYGYPIGKLDWKNYFYAGCVITLCDPNWYCKRDKLEF